MYRMNKNRIFFAIALGLFSFPLIAQDELDDSSVGSSVTAQNEELDEGSAESSRQEISTFELENIQIIGNNEAPKTVTVVPWKRAELSETVGKPSNSVLNEILRPLERNLFIRQLRYYRKTHKLP